MAKICPGFESAPNVVEIVRGFRAETVEAKICPGFKYATDVVEFVCG